MKRKTIKKSAKTATKKTVRKSTGKTSRKRVTPKTTKKTASRKTIYNKDDVRIVTSKNGVEIHVK